MKQERSFIFYGCSIEKKYLFCDVDDTIVGLKTMFSFHDYWFKRWIPSKKKENLIDFSKEYNEINSIMTILRMNGASREELNRRYYEFFVGRSLSEVNSCITSWFQDVVSENHGFFIRETCSEIHIFQSLGFEVVFVSGSFIELLRPIAQVLGVSHILATKLVDSNGILNGCFIPPQMIGAGKATAITMFLAQNEVSGAECYAMGDDYSDIPMLESVGNAIAVIGDARLEAYAKSRQWRTIKINAALEQA